MLLLGWVMVAVAGVVALRRPPLAARVGVGRDWRLICTLAVIGCTIVQAVLLRGEVDEYNNSYSYSIMWLGAIASCVTLLRLNDRQRVAALIAVTLVGGLSALLSLGRAINGANLQSGVVPLVYALLMVVACYVAQIDWGRRRHKTALAMAQDDR